MPFRGTFNGELVVPASVPDQQAVICPECESTMYPREGEGVARHFYHSEQERAHRCPNASESDVHFRCKALAVEALKQQWGTEAKRFGVEIGVDVSFTPTTTDRRFADALLEFERRNVFFGSGLIVEIQYQNRDKAVWETTYDYIASDYSVVWLTPEDFGEEQLDYSVIDDNFKKRSYFDPHDLKSGANGVSVKNTRLLQDFNWEMHPDDVEAYRSYPNPNTTDIGEGFYDIMTEYPWK